ncbi:ribonuclease J [Desulfococcaceae bacterium HSG7]|nr:ribonuclease J [Desulfococcaceae bacterium HSG7]
MQLKIIPLGGLGEIGLNMTVFEYGETALIVDAGLMFPEAYMLGVDFVIPDMEYIRQNRHKVSGIVLTHAHEDHIGALPFLLREVNAPVFGTAFTLSVASKRLEEHELLANTTLNTITPDQKLKIDSFELEFIRVSHSIVDGVGLVLQTPLGIIIHTGDFKINPTPTDGFKTDVGRFAWYGQKGVLALLSDSTNVEKEGYTISDQKVGVALEKIVSESRGRIIVALFASAITRIQQIIDLADASGRKVVFNGRSIETNVAIARELGFIHVPQGMEIDIRQISDFPDNEIVIITTGSQGEAMAALARISAGFHKQIKIRNNDTVILSSKFIPGNEKAIAKIINKLYRLGADVIYEKISAIHVSGHAFREELKLMINLTNPKYFIPIHGEYRHLILHSRLAMETGIPKDNVLQIENGQVVRFEADNQGETKGRIDKERVGTSRVLIDGKGVGDVGRSILKERRHLSEDGMVAVNMAIDEETGYIVFGPEIDSRGFVFASETGHLLEDAKCVILEIVEEIDPETPDRIILIRSKVQKALRQYFKFAIRRYPIILPFIIEV